MKTTVWPSDFWEVTITAKHSNVYYVYKNNAVEGVGFKAMKKAKVIKNDFGLDLFLHDGGVYEGRSGVRMIVESDLSRLAEIINKNGGLPKIQELIEANVAKNGESPRYARPDERKQDIFPPDPAKENIVYSKDSYGKKHYFFRFDYEGIELFTLKKETEYFRQVYVGCEGYMLGIDQHHRLEQIKKWFEGLGEGGVKGEVERRFNESMADPLRWADPGFANILGRVDEAKAHNAPIREARELEYQQRDAEREAKRIAEEQAAKTEYEQAIKTAENKILNKEAVSNTDIQGKSLIMQLFREHEIAIPLKTQGWIINALHSIEYDSNREKWSYRYFNSSRNSTVFSDYLPLLVSAVQTKQQYEEMTQNGDDAPQFDSHIENEDENDMEI